MEPVDPDEHDAAYRAVEPGHADDVDEVPGQRGSALRWRWVALSVATIAVLSFAAFAVGRSGASHDVDAGGGQQRSATTSELPSPSPPSTTRATGPDTIAPPTTAAPMTAAPMTAGHAAAAQQAVSAATYAFPIEPASSAKPSSSHHDYPASDIFAPCGSNIVATTTGSIQEITLIDNWSSKNDLPELRGGLSYSLVGDDGVRYYGSHLQTINASIRPGARVATGDRIGTVGETGNAAGTGCHLHFGISKPCGPGDVLRRRGELWPQQYLRAWKVGEQRSPAPEIQPRSC